MISVEPGLGIIKCEQDFRTGVGALQPRGFLALMGREQGLELGVPFQFIAIDDFG